MDSIIALVARGARHAIYENPAPSFFYDLLANVLTDYAVVRILG